MVQERYKVSEVLTFLSILLSILLSAISSAVISKYCPRIALVDIPNDRSSHSIPTPRGGGIGMWVALVIVGIFVTRDLYFSAILSIAGLLGLLEDRFTLSSRFRLLSQFVISSFIAFLFLGFPASPLTISLFLFWLMAYFSYFILNAQDVFLISTVLAAGCIGFLPFNFPRARVFMGDVGSIFLGFVFASLVVKLSTAINVFLCF